MIVPKRQRLLLLGLALGVALWAQEEENTSLDDLFENPQEDKILTPAEGAAAIDHTTEFITNKARSFSGNLSATGGVGVGWIGYPDLADPLENMGLSYVAQSTVAAAFDVRPDPDLRVHGGFSVSLQPSLASYAWSTIAVDELFFDYTLKDSIYFRVGKHTIAWGQGRLYTPGDLMADSDIGTAFRISFPTVFSGLSFIILAQDAYFADPTSPQVDEFAYGAILDSIVKDVRASFGLRYRGPEGYSALGSFKVILWGTDLLCDVIGKYDDVGDMSATTLAGFYREWRSFSLYGEWEHDFTNSVGTDKIGAAAAYNNINGSTVDIGVKWLHTISPSTGSVACGVTWNPFKLVEASIVLPVVYGTSGRYDIIDEDLPLTQRVSLVMLVTIRSAL